MSVQAGIWNFDGELVDPTVLARISNTTACYGPDGEFTRVDRNIGMLYRPLHTTAESCLEHQPHIFGNGKMITWDGRLDNRTELISQLGKPLGVMSTDAEIVATAYEKWGNECFVKIIGDWALAVWIQTEQKLILARDYIGVKPLFYCQRSGQVSWCSRLAPLVLAATPLTLSDEYVITFLTACAERDLTPYEEIKRVPPGCFAEIDRNGVRVSRYWSFDPRRCINYKKDKEYEEHFRELFRLAVRRRLRANGGVASELSGGFDSSSIVCMVDDITNHEGSCPTITTFSAWDQEEPFENDFAYVCAVERKRGQAGHHARMVSTGDSLRLFSTDFEASPGLGARREFKAAEADFVKQSNIRVILSGLGGDEFAGNALDVRIHLADLLRGLDWGRLGKDLIAWSLVTRIPLVHLLLESARLLLPGRIENHKQKKMMRQPWINQRFADRVGRRGGFTNAVRGSVFWKPSSRDAYCTWLGMGRVLNLEPATTAEMRYPFLDQSLTEFLMSIPTSQLIRPGERRSLMKRSLRNLLPPEVLGRTQKAAAGRYIALGLTKHWPELQQTLLEPVSCRLGYLSKDAFALGIEREKQGQMGEDWMRLLRGLSFELWLRDCMSRGVFGASSGTSESQCARTEGNCSNARVKCRKEVSRHV